jgi:hypothetical protein
MDKKKLLLGPLAAALIGLTPSAFAIQADYTAAAGAEGDEDVVEFDTYDMDLGGVVIYGAGGPVAVGDEFDGLLVSSIENHKLGSLDGTDPGLGSNYELTVVAHFRQRITAVGSILSFDILPGGDFTVYMDSTPDYDVLTDTGFDDGTAIMMGTISSGNGGFFSGIAAGFTAFISDATGDPAVSSATQLAATGVFTLESGVFAGGVLADILAAGSLGGVAIGANDLLHSVDGNVSVQPVPLPGAAVLMLGAIGGLATIGRRAKAAA